MLKLNYHCLTNVENNVKHGLELVKEPSLNSAGLPHAPLKTAPPLRGRGALGGWDSLESGVRQSPPEPPAASSPSWLSLHGAGQPEVLQEHLVTLTHTPTAQLPGSTDAHILVGLLALCLQVRGHSVQPCQCLIPLLHLRQRTSPSTTAQRGPTPTTSPSVESSHTPPAVLLALLPPEGTHTAHAVGGVGQCAPDNPRHTHDPPPAAGGPSLSLFLPSHSAGPPSACGTGPATGGQIGGGGRGGVG